MLYYDPGAYDIRNEIFVVVKIRQGSLVSPSVNRFDERHEIFNAL